MVDDHSDDRTAEIARGFAGVTVMEAGKLEPGWTGKANAIWTAAQRARGRWLLFTDADTVHEPGDLRRAMHEAERHKAGMLSYSPRQIVSGLAQRSLMPLVFCELALAYPPAKVSDPKQRIAAANGQFLLVEREAYRRLGGHAERGRQGAGGCGTGVSGETAQGGTAVSLCGRCGGYADVPVDGSDGGRLDEEPGAVVRQFAGAGGVASTGFSSSLWTTFVGYRTVERALCAALAGVAGSGLGVGAAVGANAVPVLCSGGKVEFSIYGLRAGAAGAAAVCGAAIPELVSASDIEAGKLEGAELQELSAFVGLQADTVYIFFLSGHKPIIFSGMRGELCRMYLILRCLFAETQYQRA